MATKSAENFSKSSKTFNQAEKDGQAQDFGNVFKKLAYVNITIEAYQDHCEGRLVCKSTLIHQTSEKP